MNTIQAAGSERRETPTRPFSISPAEEEEFRLALEDYRRRSGRMFPTWTEVLEVLLEVGYAKRVWRPIENGPAAETER